MQFDPAPADTGYMFVPDVCTLKDGKLFDATTGEEWVVPTSCSADTDTQCYEPDCWNAKTDEAWEQLSEYLMEKREEDPSWTSAMEADLLMKLHLVEPRPDGPEL